MLLLTAQNAVAVVNTTYIGCFADSSQRILDGLESYFPQSYPSGFLQALNMTIELCGTFCDQRGFNYSGVEFGSQCFCGSTLPNAPTSTNCTKSCIGLPSETCGGFWALQLYSITSSRHAKFPAPKIIGGTIGGLVAAVFIFMLLYFYYRRSRTSNHAQTDKVDMNSSGIGTIPTLHPISIDVARPPPQRQENIPSVHAAQRESISPLLAPSSPAITTNDASEQSLLVLQDHTTANWANPHANGADGVGMSRASTFRKPPPPYHV
jgi:hypothetical protein